MKDYKVFQVLKYAGYNVLFYEKVSETSFQLRFCKITILMLKQKIINLKVEQETHTRKTLNNVMITLKFTNMQTY